MVDIASVVQAITSRQNIAISEHFTLKEIVDSSDAIKWNIDNWPTLSNQYLPLPTLAGNFIYLANNILEPIRAWYGKPISSPQGNGINSGFRCLALNEKEGSQITSEHFKGQAVDLDLPGISTVDLGLWAQKNLPNGFHQLILENYTQGVPTSGWIHLSWKAQGNSNQLLTIKGKSTIAGFHP